MDPTIYSLIHVLSGFVLFGWTVAACLNPKPETRRVTMIVTGIASLLMVVAGFGLQAKLKVGFPVWLMVKLGCWLALGALSGLAYRKPEKSRTYAWIALVLVAIAVACVYLKPF